MITFGPQGIPSAAPAGSWPCVRRALCARALAAARPPSRRRRDALRALREREGSGWSAAGLPASAGLRGFVWGGRLDAGKRRVAALAPLLVRASSCAFCDSIGVEGAEGLVDRAWFPVPYRAAVER